MPNMNVTPRDDAGVAAPTLSSRPATAGATPAEGKVLNVLRARPASTVAEIALAAGVGRSTASKILAAVEHTGHARRTSGAIERGRRTPDRWTLVQHEKPPRLGRGALRAIVAEFLAAHPGAEFGPTAIGRAIDRSSGAVTNALIKLAGTGQVIQTGDRPVRYAATPDGHAPCDTGE